MEGGQHTGPSQHNQEQDLQQQLDNGPSSKSLPYQRQTNKRFDNDPQPSSSFQVTRKQQSSDYDKVNARLEEFVRYFVKEFEAKLHAYHLILEGERKKAGKFSDAFSEKIGHGIGGAAGAIGGFFLGYPVAGARLGATALKAAAGKLGSKKGSELHKKKAINLVDFVGLFQKDKTNFRRVLVKTGFDVFQSFEMQFMRITTDQGPKKAMQLLAKDAINRAIDYLQKEETFITEGVILGKSKIEPVLGVPIPHSTIKRPGFEVDYEYILFKGKWSTASLYEKVGLVKEKNTSKKRSEYYEKKDGKSRTDKYGYRRLFISESWDKWEDKYRENIGKGVQFTDYPYILNSKDSERRIKDILEKFKLDDEDLLEERITKIIEETKSAIIEEINLLKKQSHNYKEDRNILISIETNLKKLKIDEYVERLKQKFEEVKQGQQKIATSIEASRKENRENFNQLSQKQDIHHDDQKREHKITQEGIEGNSKKINEIHELLITPKSKQVNESVWFDVKEPVSLFTGREQVLSDLHIKIQRNLEKVTVISQMTSISGLGGMGKTQLARKYIHEYSEDYDNNVMWMDAESKETLIESFSRLAKDKLKIETKDANGREKNIKSIVDAVYNFFSNRKSFFIFDNTETNENLNTFLPLSSLTPDAKKPYVLITSRENREQWKQWGIEEGITLDVFTEEEAISFVKDGLKEELKGGNSQDDKIRELSVDKLSRFPLALQQAVAHIREENVNRKHRGEEKYTVDNYLEDYEQKRQQLLNYKAFKSLDNDYAKTTFTTWEVTIDKIKDNKEYDGQLALEILDVMAYFAPNNILVNSAFSKLVRDEKKLWNAIELLNRYSMINLEQGKSDVHRLVQEVTRLKLEEENKQEEIINKAFNLLKESFPRGKDRSEDYAKKKESLPHLEALLSHIDNWLKRKPEDKQKIEENYLKTLLVLMSEGYSDLGNSRRKKELLERALPIVEKHGDKYFEFANLLLNLGITYGSLGNHEKVNELVEEALNLKKRHYGNEDLEFGHALIASGNAYGNLGNYEKQKELLEQGLSIFKKHYGPNHLRVVKALVSLGNAYWKLGNPTKVKELLEQTLPTSKRDTGVLETLGNAYGDLGNYEKQKELLEQVLPILKEHYGLDHFKVASTLVNLSNAYQGLGDYEKQKELLEQALPILERRGGGFFEFGALLISLGNAYGNLHNYQKKKELLERVLPILERRGNKHFEFAHLLANLGAVYINIGNLDEAKKLLGRALSIFEKHYGNEHFRIAGVLVNLSVAYFHSKNYKEQKELLERALEIQEKHYGNEHFEVGRTLGALGVAYSMLNDHSKAKELLERALPIIEKHYGSEHYEVAKLLTSLSEVYKALGNLQKQKELLQRALPIFKKLGLPVFNELKRKLDQLIESDSQSGSVQSEECLPSTSSGSSGRRKREAKECLSTWEDVDEFNENLS